MFALGSPPKIVLFCRVDAFKETYQLVTNIFDYCDFIWFVISEL